MAEIVALLPPVVAMAAAMAAIVVVVDTAVVAERTRRRTLETSAPCAGADGPALGPALLDGARMTASTTARTGIGQTTVGDDRASFRESMS